MTCREFVEFLMAYFDDEVSPLERVTFDEHLAECPDCRNYLQNYQATVAAGKRAFDMPENQVPCEVPEPLVQAILAAQRQEQRH